MTSIASPRESSVNGRRVPLISTPTSSSRPSFEIPRSSEPSPNCGTSAQPLPKRNRAALREYYNLKAASALAEAANDASSSTSSIHDNSYSEVLESELDHSNFDAEAFVKHALETQNLGELLRTYNAVLTDIRALDAEKKALVYDNYSKLIVATETIRKMRNNMDPLNPMASTLDPAIKSVYERAEKIKEELREGMPEWQREDRKLGVEERKRLEKRRRTKEVVEKVLDTPERVRVLVRNGQDEEARVLWESTLTLLERWKERGVGGDDVQDCIDDGKAAMKGEAPTERSWIKLRESKS